MIQMSKAQVHADGSIGVDHFSQTEGLHQVKTFEEECGPEGEGDGKQKDKKKIRQQIKKKMKSRI